MKPYEVIRNLVEEQNMTYDDLVRRTGICRSTLHNYLNGRTAIPLSRLPAIANALGTTQEHIMGWEAVQKFNGPLKGFPVLTSVKCGYGSEIIEEATDEFAEFPKASFRGYPEDEFCVMQARGNSMCPKIENGDLLLIHMQPDVDNGQIALVSTQDGEEATLKKIKRTEDGMLQLIPLNEDYPVLTYRGKSLSSVRILGRCFQIVKEC